MLCYITQKSKPKTILCSTNAKNSFFKKLLLTAKFYWIYSQNFPQGNLPIYD